MALRIEDGYTLKGKTSGLGNSDAHILPVVNFEYRPPTSREAAQFRRDLMEAKSGEDEIRVRARFISSRLVKWDVEDAKGEVAGFAYNVVGQLPEPVILDLCTECLKWHPKPQEDAAGNSHSG